MNYTICRGTGEWSALYGPDGNLITYGDHYIVDEKVAELLGADTWHTNDFIVRPEGARWDAAAPTLAEVIGRETEKEKTRKRIAILRAEADLLEGGL